MKKIVVIPVLVSAFVILCIINQCALITDNANNHPAEAPDFGRGQNTFPMEWDMTDMEGKKLFVFDPKVPAWAVYDAKGNRVTTGSASGGQIYCKDTQAPCKTIVGRFDVFEKGTADCASKEFPLATDDSPAGGALMPYCMYFYNGYAIHGHNDIPDHNSSHGCIRVSQDAAKWLNEQFIDIGTPVVVLPYSES